MTHTIAIIANGDFPSHPIPLKSLEEADYIIACDGATEETQKHRKIDAIVGDLDSLSQTFKTTYKSIIHPIFEQETNDLTKAFRYAQTLSPTQITYLGITGKREDHTIGNIAHLFDYAQFPITQKAQTNTGTFHLIPQGTTTLPVPQNHPISIFTQNQTQHLTITNLAYQIKNRPFQTLWEATLNKTTTTQITITAPISPILIYLPYEG